MEQSIRTNVYAIVVVSFCIGLLYGMQAHAESAGVSDKATESMAKGMKADSCESFSEHVRDVTSNATITAIGKVKAEKVRARAVVEKSITLEQANTERKDEIQKIVEVEANLSKLLSEVDSRCEGQANVTAQDLIKEAGERALNARRTIAIALSTRTYVEPAK